MKTLTFIFPVIVLLNIQIYAQGSVDYSDLKEVAEKFLEYFTKGQLYDAAKFCGAEDCQKQMDILMTKMALDDSYVQEGVCTFTIDSVRIAPDQKTAKCFYTKTCSARTQPFKNHLDMIQKDNKWLVEYVYKRDKYL